MQYKENFVLLLSLCLSCADVKLLSSVTVDHALQSSLQDFGWLIRRPAVKGRELVYKQVLRGWLNLAA